MRNVERKGSKKVRKGDKVVVIAGNMKGQSGTVLECLEDRVIVEGINVRKKAVKPSQQNPKGGFQEIETPIHLSNVCPCDEAGQPLKLKVQTNESGERELFYMKDGERIIWRSIKGKRKE
jgi:large subunit ribosomal protein L24